MMTKKKTQTKRHPITTPKQKKLVKLIMENYGKVGVTKPLGELLILAGYSPETAKNPKLILDTESVKSEVEEFLKQLDDKRKLAITQITKAKLKKAPARECAYVVDLLTKNHQLLSGGSTENIFQILWKNK